MMKKIIVAYFLLIGVVSLAQVQKQNIEKSTTTRKAEFPGGDDAFRKEFMNMVHAYFDAQYYAVNGQFVFIFDIDKRGNISNLDITPKVKNSETFIEDMQFAMKKVKNKWKPALKDGKPTNSKYIIKINFYTDHTDG